MLTERRKHLAALIAVLGAVRAHDGRQLVATAPSIWRSTQLTSLNPKICEVAQGKEMTLIDCQTTFELYDTDKMTNDPYSLLNYGETRAVVGVRQSLELNADTGFLTYLQDNNALVKVVAESDGTFTKDVILRFNTKSVLEDAFLFDDVAAVKAKGHFFEFFKRPIVLNAYS